MKVVVHYKANYELQKAYLRFHLFYRQKIYVNNIIASIALIIFIVYAMLQDEITLTIAAFILFILINLLLVGMIYKIYRTNLWKKNFYKVESLTITLEEEYVELYNPQTKEVHKVEYENIYRMYDCKQYVFIYISEYQAICLDKSQVIEGDLEQYLIAFDESNYHEKYRKR